MRLHAVTISVLEEEVMFWPQRQMPEYARHVFYSLAPEESRKPAFSASTSLSAQTCILGKIDFNVSLQVQGPC
jgi:hypothetical protein